MTARDLYESALVELNKIEAPSLLLEDYNYFINKAVQQYINLVYAKLEVDQQSTDDIRVLKASTVLTPKKIGVEEESIIEGMKNGIFKSSYYVDLPGDYMHLLNCVIDYEVTKSNFKCYQENDHVYFAARRLTPNMFTQILNNAYMRPMYKRPYYYLTNINGSKNLPTNSLQDDEVLEDVGEISAGITDAQKAGYYNAMGAYLSAKNKYESALNNPDTTQDEIAKLEKDLKNKFGIVNVAKKVITKSKQVKSVASAGNRLAKPSRFRLELRFGNDDVFVPKNIYIDYLKAPMYIRLTQEQIDQTIDTSQVLEFPDYVCFEIVNIFTRLIMENASDPRLQTNMPINNTIVSPMQQAQAASK